ncbi:unnamed protein product [Rotaria magnacalcarata]|uniref:Uncharacterized protein n=1 Tax=Rotaria magnacalcarata TaxID=392030 RepID=A0A817A7M6_9BILA|nr:unnamed protein product [Rotaria magnacalcarata]CAF3732983.1 unnamed protein product [Rotaria magnacalcarata]
MSINAGYFPPYGGRRKNGTAAYHLPLNNHQHHQQHHHALPLPSARSSVESTLVPETFLPVISSATGTNESYKPYRRNDFANNHLFIAKRKLARVFLGQPTKNLQAASDLIHLFDHQEPKRKNRNVNKQQRQDSNSNKSSPVEQEGHVSVVNLVIKPPYPIKQTRDPLSAVLRNRRSQQTNCSAKTRDSSSDTITASNKQTALSATLHTITNANELVEIINKDHVSDAMIATINPFYSSLLCVKAIVPSAGPQHGNHHLLQHH